jgi:hypothetical protein
MDVFLRSVTSEPDRQSPQLNLPFPQPRRSLNTVQSRSGRTFRMVNASLRRGDGHICELLLQVLHFCFELFDFPIILPG